MSAGHLHVVVIDGGGVAVIDDGGGVVIPVFIKAVLYLVIDFKYTMIYYLRPKTLLHTRCFQTDNPPSPPK